MDIAMVVDVAGMFERMVEIAAGALTVKAKVACGKVETRV